MRSPVSTACLLIAIAAESSKAQGAPSCAPNDSAAVVAVRQRLADWVRQANSGDQAGTRDVWAPRLAGWFPQAAVFSDSAARSLGASSKDARAARTVYDLVIDDIVASGSIVVVHDIWTETREFPQPGRSVYRVIRGSELWRCQPDGRWRIARYVSAPEPWTIAKPSVPR
jgi:ketosteroid isomerase-like protein